MRTNICQGRSTLSFACEKDVFHWKMDLIVACTRRLSRLLFLIIFCSLSNKFSRKIAMRGILAKKFSSNYDPIFVFEGPLFLLLSPPPTFLPRRICTISSPLLQLVIPLWQTVTDISLSAIIYIFSVGQEYPFSSTPLHLHQITLSMSSP